ncbi:hypothetical protein J6590_107929, partial [Homalodisca vitripennis]
MGGLGDGLTLVRVNPNELGKYLSRGGTTKVSFKAEGGSESNHLTNGGPAFDKTPGSRVVPRLCTLRDDGPRCRAVVVPTEGTPIPEFKRCFPERGALVMLCGSDETRDWLRGLAPGLGIGGPGGIGVICGDYKDLIRSTKVFLRVDGPMAEKDSATILGAIKKQNAGISVSDWRVVGDVHTGDSRTL